MILKNALAQLRADADFAWDDWVRSEADEKALLAGYRPNLRSAEHVRKFFQDHLKHSKGQFAGRPFVLFNWEWERVVRPLFGWMDEYGLRRFQFAYVSVAKKNGKSALMSGLGLYGLVGDNEDGAEIYSAAYDREQAGIIYGESANMVDASPALSAILTLVRSKKRIVHKKSKSFYQALSADASTTQGRNAHYILFDELHTQKTSSLFDALRFAGRMRRQPLFLMVTTAGWDKHSICYEQYARAKRIEEGVDVDHRFFSFIAEAPADADVLDETAWTAANPSFTELFDYETFAADAREAKQSASKENLFRRYCMNQWTEQDVRWLQMDCWDDCAGEINPLELIGCKCFGGLDLATRRDVAAFVLYFPDNDHAVLPFFWMPKENARKRQDHDRVPYIDWISQGLVVATPGNAIDYNAIHERVAELCGLYDVQVVNIDPWNAEATTQYLQGQGIEVAPFGQGYASMSQPAKCLETMVLRRELRHDGNLVLRWMAANATVVEDGKENIMPSKKKSTEKIDGIVALIMAIGGHIGEVAENEMEVSVLY